MKMIAISALMCAFLMLMTSCGDDPTSPQEQIKATLEAIESAAEERSLSGIMEYISDDYADHQGYSKKDIARLIQFQIIRNQKINVFSLIRSLEVADNLASAEVSAAMSAREVDLAEESNRLKADTYRFSLVLANEDGNWRIRSVSWQRGW